MSASLCSKIETWFESLQLASQEQSKPLQTTFDQDWLSPCQYGEVDHKGNINWRPVLREDKVDFSAVEQALELELHPDIKLYYSHYWSNNIDAKTQRGQLQLLQAWNQDDFERLLQNIIGHILMKRKLKQKVTVFFAVTDEDDFILSMDNDTGQVMLEQVGLEAEEVLANNLGDFFERLTPVID